MFYSSSQLEPSTSTAVVRQKLCVKLKTLPCRKIPYVVLLSQLSCLRKTYSDCCSSWACFCFVFFLIPRGDLVQGIQTGHPDSTTESHSTISAFWQRPLFCSPVRLEHTEQTSCLPWQKDKTRDIKKKKQACYQSKGTQEPSHPLPLMTSP